LPDTVNFSLLEKKTGVAKILAGLGIPGLGKTWLAKLRDIYEVQTRNSSVIIKNPRLRARDSPALDWSADAGDAKIWRDVSISFSNIYIYYLFPRLSASSVSLIITH